MKRSTYVSPEVETIVAICSADVLTISQDGTELGGNEYGPLKPMD